MINFHAHAMVAMRLRNRIADLIRQGHPLPAVAKLAGTHERAVRNILRDMPETRLALRR